MQRSLEALLCQVKWKRFSIIAVKLLIWGSVLTQASILTTFALKPNRHKREPSPFEFSSEFCSVVGQTNSRAENPQVQQRFGSLHTAGEKLKIWLWALQRRCCWLWECSPGRSRAGWVCVRFAAWREVSLQNRMRFAAQATRPEATDLLNDHSTCLLWVWGRFITPLN